MSLLLLLRQPGAKAGLSLLLTGGLAFSPTVQPPIDYPVGEIAVLHYPAATALITEEDDTLITTSHGAPFPAIHGVLSTDGDDTLVTAAHLETPTTGLLAGEGRRLLVPPQTRLALVEIGPRSTANAVLKRLAKVPAQQRSAAIVAVTRIVAAEQPKRGT